MGPQEDLDLGKRTLLLQHGHDVAGRTVAEQLTKGLFMPRNLVPLDKREKICGGITGQRGFGEVRVRGMEVRRSGVDVGEVGPAAAGNKNLLTDSIRVVEQKNAASTPGRFARAKKPGRACAEDDGVILAR